MKKILFVNACVNHDVSRTERLAREVLRSVVAEGDEVEEIVLEEMGLRPLDSELLNRRSALIEAGEFNDELFACPQQVKQADTVVIAAPYWDFSFPAHLKIYLERLCAQGITFNYGEDGRPAALCKGEKLYYVTTAGGYIGEYDYGFMQVKSIFELYFGFKESVEVAAEGLDIITNDAEEIMAEALERAKRL